MFLQFNSYLGQEVYSDKINDMKRNEKEICNIITKGNLLE